MLCIIMYINYVKLNLKMIYKFDDIGSPLANAVFKTDCIMNKCMFQCTNDIIVVLNAAFTKNKPISPSNYPMIHLCFVCAHYLS